MPELPEVETIARQISRGFLSKRILDVQADPAIIFQNVTAEKYCDMLQGHQIEEVYRYGKFMIWKAGRLFPVFHLGMSGIFITDLARSLYPRHVHIRFHFEDGSRLFFQDVRKFSKIYLYAERPDFGHLGLDPTAENFTLNNFRKLLTLRRATLKSLLMNQAVFAGIGNIYASEILFDCGIHPLRGSDSLNDREIRKLYRSIRKILDSAVERFGTTYSAYRTVDGVVGENQDFLKVYQRAGESCLRCGEPVEKITVNSRSTFFCKKCQI